MSSLLIRLQVRRSGVVVAGSCQLQPLRRQPPRGLATRPANSADRSHSCMDPLISAAPCQEALWQGLAALLGVLFRPLRPS